MFYLISSIVLFGLIFFIEFKKSEYSYKFNDGISLVKSFKNNFSVVKFIFISLIFVSLVMMFIIYLERFGFISPSYEKFKFSLLPYVLYTVLVAPFFEEYFYRFLPYSFKKFSNVLIYVLVIFFSSLIFTIFHNTGVLESLIIFVIAIIFSIIYLKTKNISYSIGCHMLYNLFTLIRLYTGLSNVGVFMVLLLVSLGGLFVYNERKNN